MTPYRSPIRLERQHAELVRWWWRRWPQSFRAWLRGSTETIPKRIQRRYRASGHRIAQQAMR